MDLIQASSSMNRQARRIALAALATVATLAWGMPVPAHTTTPEASTSGEIALQAAISSEGKALLNRGDTYEFDRLANQYRASRERTPAGTWKLWALYHSVKILGINNPRSEQWARLETMASDWVAARPDSAAAVVVEAKLLLNHAWEYRDDRRERGTDSASRQAYELLSAQAQRVLDTHSDVAARDPEWDVIRISLAKAQGESTAALFHRADDALKREPYYYNLHFAVVDALSPAWGGSERWIKDYINLAVGQSRTKEGGQAYTRIYFNRAQNASDPVDDLNQTGAKYEPMMQSIREIIAAYPDPYNLETARALTCLGGFQADYRALGRRADNSVPPVAWWDTPDWRAKCDAVIFDGKQVAEPVSAKLFYYTSFLRGFGSDLWQIVSLASLATWVAIEFFMRSQQRGRPNSARPQPPSLNGRPAFNASVYPRVYLATWGPDISNRLAVRMALVGATIVWALQTVPWVYSLLAVLVCGLSVLVAALGVTIIVRRATSRVTLNPDGIIVRTLFRKRLLHRYEIAGCLATEIPRSPDPIVLIPRPPVVDRLIVPVVTDPDEDFWNWFESLERILPRPVSAMQA